MILTCPACQTRYQADASKFPPHGRDVRCAKCGYSWHQMPPEPEPEPEAFAAPPAEPEPFVPSVPEPAAQPDFYARQPMRDEAPREFDEPPQAEPRRRSRWPRRIFLGIGWLSLIAAVLVIGYSAVTFREQIEQVWPQSASLYTALDMKTADSGLQISDLKWHEDVEEGRKVGTVTGMLKNVSDHDLPVPQLRVGLIDSEKHELYHWTFAPEVMTLRPGQHMHFETRLSSPPEGASDLEVRFARAGE